MSPTTIQVLQELYPVGEMYVTYRKGNPADLLGFGQWAPLATGKALVGCLDGGDVSKSTVGATGGASSHLMSALNLPPHDHIVPEILVRTDTDGGHSHHTATTAAATGQAQSQPDLAVSGTMNVQSAFSGDYAYTMNFSDAPPTLFRTSEATHHHFVRIPSHVATTPPHRPTQVAVPTVSPYLHIGVWVRTA